MEAYKHFRYQPIVITDSLPPTAAEDSGGNMLRIPIRDVLFGLSIFDEIEAYLEGEAVEEAFFTNYGDMVWEVRAVEDASHWLVPYHANRLLDPKFVIRSLVNCKTIHQVDQVVFTTVMYRLHHYGHYFFNFSHNIDFSLVALQGDQAVYEVTTYVCTQ